MGKTMENKRLKTVFLITQVLLLAWFFLDMIGVYFNDGYLVTRSYKEDGIFFIIYLATIVLFIIKEKIGKWAVLVWSVMWFITQFMNHELVTITGNNYEGKMRYFAGSLNWLEIEGIYVPDVYHTILHILILVVIVVGVIYILKTMKKRSSRRY